LEGGGTLTNIYIYKTSNKQEQQARENHL